MTTSTATQSLGLTEPKGRLANEHPTRRLITRRFCPIYNP